MAIEGVDVPTMQKAVETYLQIAWGEDFTAHLPSVDFESCRTCEDVLGGFSVDRGVGNMRRYMLRLGNGKYPFMKLVFQELLVRGRFFFSVDTHDQMDIKEDYPDYEAWLQVKRYNAQLKDRIEQAWRLRGVPTFATVVAQIERETPPGPGTVAGQAGTVLVVDDNAEIAQGVSAVLGSNGYRTRQVHSAEEALEVIRNDRPDLVLSDLEMGEGLSGLEFAQRLRDDPSTAEIPFILATAASIDPTNFRVINAFLVKPFDTEVLLKFVSQHVARPRGTAGSDERRPLQ